MLCNSLWQFASSIIVRLMSAIDNHSSVMIMRCITYGAFLESLLLGYNYLQLARCECNISCPCCTMATHLLLQTLRKNTTVSLCVALYHGFSLNYYIYYRENPFTE